MNFKLTANILIFFLLSSILGNISFVLSADHCTIYKATLKKIELKHVSEFEIDSAFSKKLFNNFFKEVDRYGLYFTESDVKELSLFQYQFSEHEKVCEFIEQVAKSYSKRMENIISHLKLIDEPLDYSKQENLDFNNLATTREADEELILNRWNKKVKYRVLTRLLDKGEISQETTTDELKSEQLIVIDGMVCNLSHDSENKIKEELITDFINSLLNLLDPHSSFFNTEQKSIYQKSISSYNYTFGFELEKDTDNNFFISSLHPGSVAWKSNKIHEGDQLISILIKGEELNLYCKNVEEVFNTIYSSEVDFLTVIIKKQNGETNKVVLPKTEVGNENNQIKSYVINYNGKDYGFLSLPSFYTSLNFDDFEGSTSHLVKELMKLKMHKIDGLILDLRYNAGGSIYEVVNLIGVFIDFGPVAYLKDGKASTEILKDVNRGSAYKDNMIVLVNNFSASASEVFAGTLQDYNRAIIVGDTTYGKATAQEIFPVNNPNNYKQIFGYIKLTTNKLYRVDGSTYQMSGVYPDIVLDDYWSPLIEKEKDDISALLPYPKKIDPKLTYKKQKDLPVNYLSDKSKERRLNDSIYFKRKNLKNELALYSQTNQNTVIPLSTLEFKEHHLIKSPIENFVEYETTELKISNHKYDKSSSIINSDLKEIHEQTMEKLLKDWQLIESVKILNDFNNKNE